jgi:hypothetical protein
MPDRYLRAELLTSEAWLSVKDNADRCAWISLFLNADTFGNQPAGPHRLVHLWRIYGTDSTEKAAQCLSHLCDVDLCRVYEVDGKPYVHLPRFKQSRRYLGKLWPLSPWTTDEEKQRLAQKSQADHSDTQEASGDAPEGVGVVLNQKLYPRPPVDNSQSVDNSKPRVNPGIVIPDKQSKALASAIDWADPMQVAGEGLRLGIPARPGETLAQFRVRLQSARRKATVAP